MGWVSRATVTHAELKFRLSICEIQWGMTNGALMMKKVRLAAYCFEARAARKFASKEYIYFVSSGST